MTFKTTLQSVANTVEKIQGIKSTAYIGSDGLFDTATVTSYTKELQALSKAQAEASLVSAGLTSAQQKQVLVAFEASNVTKSLTAEQIQEKVASELNSQADAKALLIKTGIVTQKQLEENATIEVTAAKLNEAIANGTLSASDAAVIAGALGITGVNTGASISFDILTASIWANIKTIGVWLTTNPLGWIILTGAAIYGVIKAVDYFTVSTEEAMESLEETSQAFEQSTSELQSLNDELKTTADRITELEKLKNSGTISVAEENELKNLKEQNNELERNIALKQQEQAQNARKVLKDLDDADLTIVSKYKNSGGSVGFSGQKVSLNEEVQYTDDKYDSLLKKYDDLSKKEEKLRSKGITYPEKIEKDIAGNPIDVSDDVKEYINIVDELNNIKSEIEETETHYDDIYNEDAKKKKDAYEDLIDAGIKLDDTQQADYDSLVALEDAYMMHIYRVNQTEEAYKALNAEQQKSVLLDNLKAIQMNRRMQ